MRAMLFQSTAFTVITANLKISHLRHCVISTGFILLRPVACDDATTGLREWRLRYFTFLVVIMPLHSSVCNDIIIILFSQDL